MPGNAKDLFSASPSFRDATPGRQHMSIMRSFINMKNPASKTSLPDLFHSLFSRSYTTSSHDRLITLAN
jgi:hypothetical protein